MRVKNGMTILLLDLLIAGCSLIDGKSNNKTILLRISNQVGYD